MTKIMLSVAVTGEKDTDRHIPPARIYYINEITRLLTEAGHNVRHCLQSPHSTLIDNAFDTGFAAGKGSEYAYEAGMKVVYDLVDTFRDSQALTMIAIGKTDSSGNLLTSTGMDMELEHYAEEKNTEIITVYPKKNQTDMKSWSEKSKQSIAYTGNINNDNTIQNIIKQIAIV